MTPISERKAQLHDRLADLRGRVAGIDSELHSHHAKDWEDIATERESDEVLEGMGLNAQTEMRMIDAALARIAARTYGVCTKCGETIAQKRLDLLPYTPFCSICAARH